MYIHSAMYIHSTLIIPVILLLTYGCANHKNIPIHDLQKYALNYPVAKTASDMRFTLPKLPNHVETIVKNRVIDDEFKLYVSLVLARHYRSHITHANQSYAINQNHPLWQVFETYSKIKFQSEYELSSAIYYNWLSLNKNNLPPLLQVEYQAIQKELAQVGNPTGTNKDF